MFEKSALDELFSVIMLLIWSMKSISSGSSSLNKLRVNTEPAVSDLKYIDSPILICKRGESVNPCLGVGLASFSGIELKTSLNLTNCITNLVPSSLPIPMRDDSMRCSNAPSILSNGDAFMAACERP